MHFFILQAWFISLFVRGYKIKLKIPIIKATVIIREIEKVEKHRENVDKTFYRLKGQDSDGAGKVNIELPIPFKGFKPPQVVDITLRTSQTSLAEFRDEAAAIQPTTVGVYRTAATVKGGRRFSFSALVVAGDRNGRVGAGYGRANQVPPAIEKAEKEARRRMREYPLTGRTIPHMVEATYCSSRVRLIPASPGTGIIAGKAVRKVVELAGIADILTKTYGSTNALNVVKATMVALAKLRSLEQVLAIRQTLK